MILLTIAALAVAAATLGMGYFAAVTARGLGPFLVIAGIFALFVGVVLLLALLHDPFPPRGPRATKVGLGSRIHVTVGSREKHDIDYRWDQVWGWLTVAVDDVLVYRALVLLSFRLVRTVELTVGRDERHVVRIEKRRPLLFAFSHQQPVTVFVDGKKLSPTGDG